MHAYLLLVQFAYLSSLPMYPAPAHHVRFNLYLHSSSFCHFWSCLFNSCDIKYYTVHSLIVLVKHEPDPWPTRETERAARCDADGATTCGEPRQAWEERRGREARWTNQAMRLFSRSATHSSPWALACITVSWPNSTSTTFLLTPSRKPRTVRATGSKCMKASVTTKIREEGREIKKS